MLSRAVCSASVPEQGRRIPDSTTRTCWDPNTGAGESDHAKGALKERRRKSQRCPLGRLHQVFDDARAVGQAVLASTTRSHWTPSTHLKITNNDTIPDNCGSARRSDGQVMQRHAERRGHPRQRSTNRRRAYLEREHAATSSAHHSEVCARMAPLSTLCGRDDANMSERFLFLS